MTDHRTPDDRQRQPGKERKQKKQYQKPAFRYERVFETTALSCGKLAGESPLCNSIRKTS
jgi:hypothetical protein